MHPHCLATCPLRNFGVYAICFLCPEALILNPYSNLLSNFYSTVVKVYFSCKCLYDFGHFVSKDGTLLRMNRSIQSEGTFGVLKWDRSYKRLFRRGEKNVILELTLISCRFNLYKYHNKKQRQMKVA